MHTRELIFLEQNNKKLKPASLLAKYAGLNNLLAVIIGVGLELLLYFNTAKTILITEVLLNKGVALGIALSFMMVILVICYFLVQ